MTPEEWAAAKAVLGAALELPGTERAAFLEKACGADVELRRRVESLIEADEQDWSLLEAPAVAASSLSAALRPLASGERVGVYEILEEIGHGGMGVVYRARRADRQFEKTVAIKLTHFGAPGEALHQRFRAERQIVASLEHPNIARLLDGGTTADGRPYFVMELVEGRTLVEWCDARKMPVRDRLTLFLDVCAAVESAHARGVIHRDLKPTNILVTDEGTVKLLDFGIAKLVGPDPRGEAGGSGEETGTAFGLMTPDYASPEQLRGDPVTPASDVYALGVVLYELLAGRRPHRVSASSPVEIVRAICETEAPKASRVAPPAAGRFLSGDLDTVLAKALRKEPGRRYGTARELADDLRRFLEGRPVQARPDSPGYRARKFAGRHRASIAAAVVAALAVAAALAYSYTLSARRAALPARWPAEAAGAKTVPRTLAVLPFQALGGAPADAVLELGMADTLITRLSSVPGISVRPTGAVLAYSGKRSDAVRAGRELRVDAVVEGSLQRVGGRTRVSVRLIRVDDAGTVWGRTFDAADPDVFAVEDSIARAVAEALVPRLSSEAKARLALRGTDDWKAYGEYLKGRYFWSRRTEADFRKAIGHFTAAISADDGYALAHAGLADCYSLLGVWGAGPPRETLGLARASALRAASFTDAPGEAHASSAFVKWVYDWDWPGAEREFRRAIELSPNDAKAHQWYAYYLASRRHFDEAVAEIRRAQELDPLSVSIVTDLGEIHCWAGRYEEAVSHLRQALDLEPNFALAHNVLGMTYLRQGRIGEGLAELEAAFRLDGSPRMISTLGYGYAAAGRSHDARQAQARLEALARSRYVSPFSLAVVHAGLGEDDRALELLESAYRQRSDTMAILDVYPLMERLRAHPRYAALMARVGSEPRP